MMAITTSAVVTTVIVIQSSNSGANVIHVNGVLINHALPPPAYAD